ncbi:1-phosphatidylinositol-4-phosphate 5-kinase, partial [Ostertagia ostertagi]
MVAQYLPPEQERRQSNEDIDTSTGTNAGSPTGNGDSLSVAGAAISTVSSGTMLWTRQSGIGATPLETKEASFAQSMRKPPSLLCVNELYLQHENRPDTEDNIRANLQEEEDSGPDWFRNMDPDTLIPIKDDNDNIRANLQEEEDSGPDWFRNMDPDTLIPIKDDNKVRESEACTTENHFDPLSNIRLRARGEKYKPRTSASSVKASLSLSPSKTQLDDDIERAFDLRAEHLLSYLCSRERLRDLRWKPIILKLAKEIAHTVKVDVAKRHDNMNIVNYVHVKKLYVDYEEPQTELLWGVVCSKTVSHESMAQPLRDASVMIVAGSIEYERVQGRLSTLEPILNQEGEFLSKQVERILSRRPSVLLVEGGVSRLAADLLCEAGVRLVSDFEQALAESVLSASPFIDYEPPYLGIAHCCRILTCQSISSSHAKDFDARLAEEENEVQRILDKQQNIPVPEAPRHYYATCGARDADSAEHLSSFRAFSGVLFRKRLQLRKTKDATRRNSKERQRSGRHDMLDPYVHQRVAVLFGSFSPKSPNAPYFCVRPWVVNMEFYGPHDMTLGEFLTKFCFNKSYECASSNCEVPMLDHSRKLVYGRVCVEVTTQIVVSGSDESSIANASPSQIFAWNYCDGCKLSSPVVPVNSSVWHLSFGKYLDYIAYTGFSKVRPYDVQFSPVQCRIVPNQYSKQALLDGVTRMASLADDIVRTAEDRLRLFTQHDHYGQYAGTFHTVLRQVVEKTIALIAEKREYAEELTSVDRVIIPSNDIYAVKANEALMRIREAIYQLITTWNDQSTVLAATVRAVKKNSEDNGVVSESTDIGLERIDDPFPTYLHLGLKLQPRVGVVVRDIMDSRGNYKPDIGSIIAYALSSADYEENRRKQRDAAKGEQPPLNLNSSSVASDEQALAAEHLEIEFQDNQASYYVKAYYAARFRLLRKLLFTEGEEAFIRSLSQSTFWTPQGGKSGSFFYRTQDDRFVVKQMSRFEIQSFVEFAPHYFEYVKTAVVENKLTALCKVYGVFRVGYKSKSTQLKFDILVMEYLFYKHNVNQVWDLKGSLRNRMASTGKSTSDLVLLDENLMKDLWNKQLYIYPHAKAALNQAISNDSHFLSSQ